MCGFAGFLTFSGNSLSTTERHRILALMGRAMAHRGPDDERYFDDGMLSLVFRRLAIVDVERGQQPMFNEDRTIVCVANGEIYNHGELRRQLANRHAPASDSDCEVLLHGYEQWGLEAFARCRGMFAAALWERRHRRLTLVRDRLGIKPLYVCRLADGLLFGSELKALLVHPECPRELDMSSLAWDVSRSPQVPTFVRGIEFVPAASSWVTEPDGRSQVRAYWNLDDHLGAAPFGACSERYVDALCDLVESSVGEHLQGDGAAAIHLSGGLDSSLLAGLVARRTKDAPCFTVVERTTLIAGDVASAGRCAEKMGLPWYPVHYQFGSLADDMAFGLDRLEESVWMMDSPRFDLEWVMKAELTRAIRQHRPDIKTILLGQGVDEFAGGYSNRLDAPRTSWSKYLADEISPFIRANDATADNGRIGAPYHRAMRLFLRQLQHHNLWHEDRTSAWHGIEARVPFLDHRIVELLASVPATLHETLFWNKRIFREGARRLLPGFDWQRPKVAFCCTDDTRSLDISVHGLATRVLPQFLDKYLAQPDLPFERSEMLELSQRIVDRAPGFYADSYRFFALASIAVFKQQCLQPPEASVRWQRSARPSLPLVQSEAWLSIHERMTAQPVIPSKWWLGDRLGVPEAAQITCFHYPDGHARFTLTKSDKVFAEMELHRSPRWLNTFLSHLGKGAARDFTIQDWLDEFDIGRDELFSTLDVLYQCGLVNLVDGPESKTRRLTDIGAEPRN